jgi:hypothetical protein
MDLKVGSDLYRLLIPTFMRFARMYMDARWMKCYGDFARAF